jgi:hypothetical protein
MVNWLEEAFPGLAQGNYEIKSPRDNHYNCIAWAAGDTERWWWPISEGKVAFWPDGVIREETLSAFGEAFATFGFTECDNEFAEPNTEKIAIFADKQGIPLHAARLLPNGKWTSKLGELQDIEHGLRDLEGEVYGSVVLVMKRRVSAVDSSTSEVPDESPAS